jgi:inositol monophosphatase 3
MLTIIIFCVTDWGFVGHGHSANLVTPETFTTEKMKIIVSRSHSGSVEQVTKAALGDAIEIIPAGGAGKH